MRSPISAARKDSFFADYLKGREGCRALEASLERAGALEREPHWDESHVVGFNVRLKKAPFVEGSNYLDYRGWQFALALERFLLNKFEEAILQGTSYLPEAVQPTWASIFAAVQSLSEVAGATDPATRLIVITGVLRDDWLGDLIRQDGVTPDWDLDASQNKTWILGAYYGSLILQIVESETPALYVLDASQFATLTEFGSPRLEVDAISEEEARRIIEARNEPPTPQRLRELRLSAHMRLHECWHLEKVQGNSAGAHLA